MLVKQIQLLSSLTDKGTGYQVGDVLGLPVAVTGVSTTLSDASADITVTQAQADELRAQALDIAENAQLRRQEEIATIEEKKNRNW